MRKIILVLSVVTVSVIQSCNLPAPNSNNVKEENESLSSTVTNMTDFTKSFSGTINDKYKIEMTLIKTGKMISGNYKYSGKESSLKITGTIDNSGNFTINEFNDNGSMTGIFKGQLNGAKAIGQWSKPDGSKTMPFSINETSITSNNIAEGNVVSCSQQENKNDEGGDPIIIKTCLFNSYKTVSTGSPDYKGRYSYQYELYMKQNGKYVKVNNSALFNQNQNQLLSNINQEIQKDYKIFSTDPVTKDCFKGMTSPKFTIDQLGIDFDDNKINFSVTFGLSSACMSVDGTTVSFTLDEIQSYLYDNITLSNDQEQELLKPAAPINNSIFEDIGQKMIVIIAEKDLKPPVTDPKLMYSIYTESFKRSGYSYLATIHKVATEGYRLETTQLISFLLLPIANLKEENFSEIFSGQELEDVKKIVKMLKN